MTKNVEWDWVEVEKIVRAHIAQTPKDRPISLRKCAARIPERLRLSHKGGPMTHNTLYAHIQRNTPDIAKVLGERGRSYGKREVNLLAYTDRRKRRKAEAVVATIVDARAFVRETHSTARPTEYLLRHGATR